MKKNIWFWQRIISPHMAGLASALAEQGHEVFYVAEQGMSPDRARQGWTAPDLGSAVLMLAPEQKLIDRAIDRAPIDSIHICQGIRSNGLVGYAQEQLQRQGLRHWVVMETVDDKGVNGIAKKLLYRYLLRRNSSRIAGLLAIGHTTGEWLVARGFNKERVFDFAYFLPEPVLEKPAVPPDGPNVHFVFVGQLIHRKAIDILLKSLALIGADNWSCALIGDGPEKSSLVALGNALIPAGKIKWLGQMSMADVRAYMKSVDCLILPSRHDGWGAVVSEALMAGTPVICSSACGSAAVVEASGYGAVVKPDDVLALAAALRQRVQAGQFKADERVKLQRWGVSLGTQKGARYLSDVLEHSERMIANTTKPVPPWED